MKCQILFSGENKKNVINLSSAVLAKRVVMVKDEGFVCSLQLQQQTTISKQTFST